MKSVPNLRTVVEDVELHHVAFEPPFRYLKRRVDDALAGYGYRIERLIGPSRVGKSMLFKALARLYPALKIDGRREVSVLHVQLKNFVSPLALPTTVLKALGVAVPRGRYNGEELLTLMQDQLRLARTRVMLFEEASHVVERGSRVDPHDAADWFKGVAESLNVTLLMEGVPRLELLFECNEQLRLRASRRLEFWPYDIRNPSERSAFAACVKTYADLFASHGWPVEVPLEALVPNCYLLSGGRVGVLAKFMQELAATVDGSEARPLTWKDLGEAADIIEGAGHPDHRAFARSEVTEVELAAAYGYAINDSDMPLRRRKAVAGSTA
jgi:hypothetical protein